MASSWPSSASSGTSISSSASARRAGPGVGFAASRPLALSCRSGISFYTFQTMSYTIDIYRGAFTPTRSFVDFAPVGRLLPAPGRRPDSAGAQPHRPDRAAARRHAGTLGARPDAAAHRAHPESRDRRPGRRRSPTLTSPVRIELHVDPARLRAAPVRPADLQRFRGLQRDGARIGQPDGLRSDAQLPPPVLRPQHLGVLAAVAHLAVDVAARLPVHPARRQPRKDGAHLRQPDDHDAPRRALARRELELRHLGRAARQLPVCHHAWTQRRGPSTALRRPAGAAGAGAARRHPVRGVHLPARDVHWLFFRSHDLATTAAYLSGLFASGADSKARSFRLPHSGRSR